MIDTDTEALYQTLKSGEFFEINDKMQKIRKLKVLQNNKNTRSEKDGGNDKQIMPPQTCLMRFTLKSLINTFKSQIELKNDFIKQELMRFNLFSRIGTKQIEDMAKD